MIRGALVSIVVLVSNCLFAQSSHQLNWEDEPIELQTDAGLIKTVGFDGAYFSSEHQHLPVLYVYEPASSFGEIHPQLTNKVFEPFDATGLDATLGNEITVNALIATERKEPYASITIVPLRLNPSTGQAERLISFDLAFSQQPVPQEGAHRGTSYASTSVLATGNWYKFSTNANGVYKLTYDFLKDELEMPVDQIDPRNIRVYGNGGGMLPELNGDFRYDDLQENAIIVSGEADGVFNSGDYILMYGTSADQWISNPAGDRHTKHLYSTTARYFITADLGPGKRMSTNAASVQAATYTSSSFNERLFFEEELNKLTESGRVWYGQEFNINLTTQSYNFNLPNLTSDSVTFKIPCAARCLAGSNQFRAYANGALIGSTSIGKTTAGYQFAYGLAGTITGKLPVSNPLTLRMDFIPSPSDAGSLGWFDYIEVLAHRQLKMSGSQMTFRDHNSVGPGAITDFRLSSSADLTVWNITNPLDPRIQQHAFGSGAVNFKLETDSLLEFIAFDGSAFLTPTAIGSIPNQDIHGTIGQPDLVIITNTLFKNEAEQLAQHHRDWDGHEVAVVGLPELYNEFSSGVQDICAIRDLMKMLYERATTAEELPEYLILFGDGSYDYKNIEHPAGQNTNFVPTYQSPQTLHSGSTYTSDDFFGLLDDNEGLNIESSGLAQKLDIAVGRLIVNDLTEAQAVVNKIMHYAKNGVVTDIKGNQTGVFGSWRNVVTFIGDDEDSNIHINDSDDIATDVEAGHPVYNVGKIYLDAYPQVSTSGGSRYPDVNTAITNSMFTGTLILNYTGHGGEVGWAHERIFSATDLDKWKNLDKLPLIVTATCSFSKFDNPAIKTTGEKLFVKPDGGAIALVTTVRLVYSSANKQMNSAFMNQVFERPNGEMLTLGEVMVFAKNNAQISENNRKFILLGDPAITLAYPQHNVVTTAIDSKPFVTNGDTLKALSKVTIEGEVQDAGGSVMNNFNGVVFPTIYDKPVAITTLKNDPGSIVRTFSLQKSIIYKGKASVANGAFSYTFVVPKDISYNFGSGKISYYAHTEDADAQGYDNLIIGGTASNPIVDETGPQVEVYMNDEQFAFGGLTDDAPLLLVKLTDDNGINTSGIAIGHDIAGTLDDDDQNKIVLNEFYEAELDNYQAGEVRYPLSDLDPGVHSMIVKAWDTYNNPGEGNTEFVVAESADLALAHVLNYPNPFTTNTTFWFEHNRPCEYLDVRVEIYATSGKLVKSLEKRVLPDGYLVKELQWDGLDDYGDKIGRGVYVYKLDVTTPDGANATEFEKLVILR